MKRALIIGKFYPPHAGHDYLIQTATDECDEVMVMVLWSHKESIDHLHRAETLRINHPFALVVTYRDELSVDFSSREADRAHAERIAEFYTQGFTPPDVVYSSEEYGPRLAENLSALLNHTITHRMVDHARENVPVSATAVRSDIPGNWQYLSRYSQRYLCKTVVIVGAESSGTTTLAKSLAEHYKTAWVPEYGRLFSEAVGPHHEWTTGDFLHIAKEAAIWAWAFYIFHNLFTTPDEDKKDNVS